MTIRTDGKAHGVSGDTSGELVSELTSWLRGILGGGEGGYRRTSLSLFMGACKVLSPPLRPCAAVARHV